MNAASPVNNVTTRVMHTDEFDEMKALSVKAFDEPAIGVLLDGLRESWAWIPGLSFVAELDGRIVGQVCYTHAILDAPTELKTVLVLSPVGIDPQLHHQGIGTALINHSLDAIVDRSEPAVFLEGNPVYYERFGFVAAGELGFRRPSLRTPAAAFQVRPQPSWSDDLAGTLVYPDAFWRTDSVGLR